MDPLSITTSILTIFGAVYQIVSVAKQFRDVPGSIDSLLNDLADAEVMVRTVESSLQVNGNIERIPQDQLARLCEELVKAKDKLLEFHLLVQMKGFNTINPSKYKRASWLLAKGKLNKLKQKLENILNELRHSLGQFKTSCIELELQHVSVVVDETAASQLRLEEQGTIISQTVDQLFENHQLEAELMHESHEVILQTALETRSTTTEILHRFANIEQYLLTENIKSNKQPSLTVREESKPVGSDQPHQPKISKTVEYQRVAVHTRHRQPFRCEENCPCDCHIKSAIYTPDGLRSLLGQLFVGYNGMPVATKTCTYSRCARKTAPASQITYFFPQWWVAQRMLNLVSKMTALGGPAVTLKFPRIVPASSRIFRHAYLGEVEAMRGLFFAGLASPSDIDGETGTTPLHSAFFAADEKAIKYLLHKGADRTIKNFAGLSPVEEAWTRLLTNSVNPSQRRVLEGVCDEETLEEFEFTDLHRSVVRISSRTVGEELLRLVRSSATIDDTDSSGRTALSWAAEAGDEIAVRLLLAHGADPNKARPRTKTPLHYAAGWASSPECTRMLVRLGADLGARDPAGLTPLMWSCINVGVDFSTLQILLEGSDTELEDINGRTALFHAATTDLTPTKMLLRRGCNVNHADGNGFTALHLAITYNHGGIVQTLLEHGADPHVRLPESQQSILHHTAHYAELEVVKALSACQLVGLDVDAKDKDGCTALDLLETRIPEPSPEFFDAFRTLLIRIESRTLSVVASAETAATQRDVNKSNDSEGTPEWETASEAATSLELCSTVVKLSHEQS